MKRPRIHPAAWLAACAAAVVAAAFLLSPVFAPKNNQAAFGQVDEAAWGVLGEAPGTVDVLFVGDSEVYTSLSPLQMWEEQGFTSYDVSTSGQPLCYSRALLERALERQRPRVVVLETNMLFRKMKVDQVLWREAANLVPLLEYHGRWKSLTAADLTARPRATWTHPGKGFRPVGRTVPSRVRDHMKPTEGQERISTLNRIYLDSIIGMCRDRGIRVVLLSTPSTVNWNRRRHNAVKAYLDESAAGPDVRYLDLNLMAEEVPIDWGRDTSDGGDHLNVQGAEKVSAYVGGWLKRAYGLADRRGDPSLKGWDQSAARGR